jgi:hypothetical protein
MSGKLRDPDLPPGAVVRIDAQTGEGIRNDGKRLKPAAKNPWYVLATIAGEQTKQRFDTKLHERNRRYWNGWACSKMSEEERAELAERLDLRVEELAPWSKEERATVVAAFAERLGAGVPIPDPSKTVDFRDTHVKNTLGFLTCVLAGHAWFRGATFSRSARFAGATFSGSARFAGATFSGHARFDGATFSGNALFDGATFSGDAWFDGATFSGYAAFSDGAFDGPTSFAKARFSGAVPTFYNRRFHQDTDITTDKAFWPPVTEENARDSKRAYTRLRQIMAELHKPDAEAFFGRQELRCDEVLDKGLSKWVSRAYGVLSDYGFSFTRPALALAGMIRFLWPLYGSWLKHGAGQEGAILSGLGLSFANTFPYLGFQRLYFDVDVIRAFPWWLKLLGGFQTVAGGVLLFLLLLGLRNRFRLR